MRSVAFVEKYPAAKTPWVEFGSSQAEYDKWISHTCGICCLKMVADTVGVLKNETLYDLTMGCLERGGFKISESGEITGVFHYPLLEYARSVGLDGQVERDLTREEIKSALEKGMFVLLSIDLAKATTNHRGGHLILVHSYHSDSDSFVVHDCSHVVAPNGKNAVLPAEKLEALSNKKGLTLFSTVGG